MGTTESRLTKRTDIPTTPVQTEYDSIIEFIFTHMNEYIIHPLLLSTALQLMFAFDTWTFSRAELCRHLFEYILTAIPTMPLSLVPRLFHYICRLLESPVLVVDHSMVEQLFTLTQQLTTLPIPPSNVDFRTAQHAAVQTLATAVCYVPGEGLDLLKQVVQPIVEKLQTIVTALPQDDEQGGRKGDMVHVMELTEQAVSQLRALAGIFDGCLLEPFANQLAGLCVSVLHALLHIVLTSSGRSEEMMMNAMRGGDWKACRESILRAIVEVYLSITRAAETNLDEGNVNYLLLDCSDLLNEAEFCEQGLIIVDSLLCNAVSLIPQDRRTPVFFSVSNLLSLLLSNHAVGNHIDSVKYILHIMYVLVKEDMEIGMRGAEQVVKMMVELLNEGMNEEELIRLVLRQLVYLVIVGNRVK